MKQIHLNLIIYFITVKNIFLFHFRNNAALWFYWHTHSKNGTLSAERNKEKDVLE